MALIKCPECGKEYSDKAAECPGCGAVNKKIPWHRSLFNDLPRLDAYLNLAIKFLVIILLIVVIVRLIFGNSDGGFFEEYVDW